VIIICFLSYQSSLQLPIINKLLLLPLVFLLPFVSAEEPLGISSTDFFLSVDPDTLTV